MYQPFQRWVSFVTLTVVFVITGCSQFTATDPRPIPSPVASVPPVSPSPVATPPVDPEALWQEALAKAATAEELSQSAQSRDDWTLVSTRWEQAIALLRQIPSNSDRRAEVEGRVNEYKNRLATAQQRANITTPNVTLTAPVASETPSPAATGSPAASSPATIALATHLKTVGATLYLSDGECAECQRQREILGAEAIAQITVVTCATATNPTNSPAPASPDPCQQANVTTYPTWQINNQLYPGVQSPEQLAELSGYEGTSQGETVSQLID